MPVSHPANNVIRNPIRECLAIDNRRQRSSKSIHIAVGYEHSTDALLHRLGKPPEFARNYWNPSDYRLQRNQSERLCP